jgi:hypothetical protein
MQEQVILKKVIYFLKALFTKKDIIYIKLDIRGSID